MNCNNFQEPYRTSGDPPALLPLVWTYVLPCSHIDFVTWGSQGCHKAPFWHPCSTHVAHLQARGMCHVMRFLLLWQLSEQGKHFSPPLRTDSNRSVMLSKVFFILTFLDRVLATLRGHAGRIHLFCKVLKQF